MASHTDSWISRAEQSHLGQVAVGHHARGVAVVTLRGEHDLSTQPVLTRALKLAAAHSSVVVDLSECSFIDSTVITELINTSQMLRASGERFMLVIPPSQAQVVRIAKMVRLDEMFEVHGSTDAAFARLKEEKRDQAPAS
jgi:anti-sigma B factor antagonist